MNADTYFGVGLGLLGLAALILTRRFWRDQATLLVLIWSAILAISLAGAVYFVSRGQGTYQVDQLR